MKPVWLVSTGTANLASVKAAVRRAGYAPLRVKTARQIADAEQLIVPGVGTLDAAMQRLECDGLIEPLRERLLKDRPTLAICLGMQMLASSSQESPGQQGLGIIAGRVRRLPPSVRVPQLGWNRVVPEPGQDWIDPGYAYFANSYALREAPGNGWKVAWSDHGGPFVAALARGRLFAYQFHPELSGQWGRRLIERWLSESAS